MNEKSAGSDDALELVPGKASATAQDQAELESLVLEGDDVPRRVLIAPWGEVNSAVGSFVVDAEGAAAVIASFVEHGTDIPIDYEHQTLGGAYASPTGQAPAAGWIKSLRAVTPEEAVVDAERPAAGLWAEVEWTPAAAEQPEDAMSQRIAHLPAMMSESCAISASGQVMCGLWLQSIS